MHIGGLVQDCCNSGALAQELLQSGTKPLIYGPPSLKSFIENNSVILIISRNVSWAHDIIVKADGLAPNSLSPATMLTSACEDL